MYTNISPSAIIDHGKLPQWVKVQNCAYCGTICISQAEIDRFKALKRNSDTARGLPRLAGVVRGRPCCQPCAAQTSHAISK